MEAAHVGWARHSTTLATVTRRITSALLVWLSQPKPSWLPKLERRRLSWSAAPFCPLPDDVAGDALPRYGEAVERCRRPGDASSAIGGGVGVRSIWLLRLDPRPGAVFRCGHPLSRELSARSGAGGHRGWR